MRANPEKTKNNIKISRNISTDAGVEKAFLIASQIETPVGASFGSGHLISL